MKQKILTKDLKLGMYVTDLDRPWLETHFLFQGLQIKDEQDIKEITRICKYVYIEVEENISTSASPLPPVHKSLKNDKKATSATDKPEVRPYVTTFEDEFQPALQIQKKIKCYFRALSENTQQGIVINALEIEHSVLELVDSVLRNPDALTLLSNLNDKDEFVSSHSFNVCIHSIAFGRYLGMNKENLLELGMAGLLHDIGEICIPSDILEKEGNLTPDEQMIKQTHTSQGAKILKHAKGMLLSTIETALSHHERSNGSGYPQGLKWTQLHPVTKIVAIVDFYDSATNPRFGKPINITDALKNLYDLRDTLFETELVEQFIQCHGVYPIGSLVELDTGEVGIVISFDHDKRLLPRLLLVRDKEKTPYYHAHIMNLSLQAEKTLHAPYIAKILPHGAYGIDTKEYLLKEMSFGK